MKFSIRRHVRQAALALTVLLILSAAVPVLAASEQVYATTGLNVRSGPSTRYSIVGVLKKGQVVTRTGRSGSWSVINVNGRAAYASSSYLRTAASSAPSPAEKVMYTTGGANVRSGPGTRYKVVGTLAKGASVSVVGATGSWSIIDWNGGTAYVSSSLLTSVGSSGGSTSSGSGAGNNPASGTVEATTNVNIRSGPSSKFSRLGTLRKGSRLERTGVVGSWTQVNYNGKSAYISSTYLRLISSGSTPSQPSTPSVTPASGTVEAVIACNVHSGPGTNYARLGALAAGARIVRTGISGNWTRVAYNGRIGFVFTSYLKTVDASTDQKMYVTDTVVMRSGAGEWYPQIITLQPGISVIQVGTAGSWAKVEYGVYTGYVPAGYLSKNPVAQVEGMAYATYRVPVLTGAGVSFNVYGYLEPGEGVAAAGSSGAWMRVIWRGSTGYVLRNSVVLFTSAAQTQFTAVSKTMYAAADNLPVYIVPQDASPYRYALMTKDEKVQVTAQSGLWSRLNVDGRILYTLTSYLTDVPSAPGYNDPLTITSAAGAAMYSDGNLNVPYPYSFVDNTNTTVTLTAIPAGETVQYRGAVGKAYYVYWAQHNLSIYVNAGDTGRSVTPFTP